METQAQEHIGNNVQKTNNLDYSKAKMTMKNITIPNSRFSAKWNEETGYSVGLEGIRITKDYATLEQALNKVGYGVDKDHEGDELLVKHGETDFETIANIVEAMLILREENKNG